MENVQFVLVQESILMDLNVETVDGSINGENPKDMFASIKKGFPVLISISPLVSEDVIDSLTVLNVVTRIRLTLVTEEFK
jgi:hypothetical protein